MAERSGRPTRVVVVGWGPVAARLVEGLLPGVVDGALAVTVVGAEPEPAYNRVLVAEYAVGRASRDRLDVADGAGAAAAGVDLRLGRAVVAVDRERQRVRLDDGDDLPWDRLVLATGARSVVPALTGAEAARVDRLRPRRVPSADRLDEGTGPLPAGVVVLRDLRDARVVLGHVRARRRLVVLGAGVLGTELALAAAEQGAAVTVVHTGEVPLARDLDRGGGRTLALALRRAGVALVARARAQGILFADAGTSDARFRSLLLADGGQVDGDLLVLSCGVAARDELAAAAGLAVARGVLVDEELRSWTDPDVFALGDCAHVAEPPRAQGAPTGDAVGAGAGAGAAAVGAGAAGAGAAGAALRLDVPGGPSGLVGPGWRQAERLAGDLLAEAGGAGAGHASGARARGAASDVAERRRVVVLKAEGVDVVAAGDVTPEPWDEPLPVGPTHVAGCGQGDPTGGAGWAGSTPAAPAPATSPTPTRVGGTAPGRVPKEVVSPPTPREVTVWADPGRGTYCKLVTRDGVLEGFVSVGLPRTGAELTLLFERGGELPEDRAALLRLDAPDVGAPRTSDPADPAATVCWCNGVTAGAIAEAAAGGATSVDEVGRCTRAGTGCGTCRGRIAEVLARAGVVAAA